MANRRLPREQRACAREGCPNTIEVVLGGGRREARFCSRSCARMVDNTARSARLEAEWLASERSLCVCGERIPYERRYYKFHSAECADRNQGRRRRVESNYVNLTCETCGEEFERYKGLYKPGARTFCSNECAAKWTRKVQHLGVDDVVLDSGYEALVWGICKLHKIPIERVDRTIAVPYKDGWYAPDFVIEDRYVEVKGYEDDDDRGRYVAWNDAHPERPLVILDKDKLIETFDHLAVILRLRLLLRDPEVF